MNLNIIALSQVNSFLAFVPIDDGTSFNQL